MTGAEQNAEETNATLPKGETWEDPFLADEEGINGVVVGTTRLASSQICYRWHWHLYNQSPQSAVFSFLKAGW